MFRQGESLSSPSHAVTLLSVAEIRQELGRDLLRDAIFDGRAVPEGGPTHGARASRTLLRAMLTARGAGGDRMPDRHEPQQIAPAHVLSAQLPSVPRPPGSLA